MRKDPTPAERALWSAVRDDKLGAGFRRQHPIGTYIADFCCPKASLVIELDGSIHDTQKEQDAVRQEFIEGREYRVLRFQNEVVLNELPKVVLKIRSVLTDGAS